MEINLGKFNTLRVVKEVDFGMYLDGGMEGEILLPKRYVPKDCKPGDELRVFIYLDQEERLIATTQTPLAQVGEFACLEVAWVNQYGAFLNWGLMKDLFVPFREQKTRMEVGRKYIVHVHLDEESYRIAADSDWLFRYLYEADLKVAYLDRYIVRMRMGGLSTDRRRMRMMWQEDVRMYRSHGLPPVWTKLQKMAWKVPQFFG